MFLPLLETLQCRGCVQLWQLLVMLLLAGKADLLRRTWTLSFECLGVFTV